MIIVTQNAAFSKSLIERHREFIRKCVTSPPTLKTIKFTLVHPDDAEYIHNLRLDEKLNKHISPPPISVAAQKQWIEKYIDRAQAGLELYFVIRRLNGSPCGTVRMYDYRGNSYSWGSWILDENKTARAAVESAVLVYNIGFNELAFDFSHADLRKENVNVIKFHQRFGAKIKAEDELNIYMTLTKEDYYKAHAKIMAIIDRPHGS